MSVLKPPSWRMTLGSIDFQSPKYVKLVRKIEIHCVDEGPDAFTVELDDSAGEATAELSASLKEGGTAKIKLGYTGGPYHDLMDGLIKGVEISRKGKERRLFRVTGFDHTHGLTEVTKTCNWENIKDSDIASEAARECGLQADVEDTGVVREHVACNNRTWQEFLLERASLYGFELHGRGRKMEFKKPEVKGPVCELIYDRSIFTGGNQVMMEKVEFETSTTGQVTEVIVRHYDPQTALTLEGRSSTVTKVGGSSTGGERAASSTQSTTLTVTDVPVHSVQEAEKVAFDRLNAINGVSVTGKGTCRGDGRILPRETVKIDAEGDAFDGEYLVTMAKHILKAGGGEGYGYATEFEVRRTSLPS